MKTWKIILIFMLAVTFDSCNKEEEREDIYQSAEDDAMMLDEFSAIHDFVNEEARNIEGIKKMAGTTGILPTCAIVLSDTINKVISIDFGPTNCPCDDGVYRRGKIIATFKGPYHRPGTTAEITLYNFFANDIQFTGTQIFTNLERDTLGNFKYRITSTDASAITPEGTINWSYSAAFTRTAGETTTDPYDDIYTIDVISSGTNRKGGSYTMAFLKSLKKAVGCRNIMSGVTLITNSREHELELNFDPESKESCDRIADANFKGKTKRITLR